MSSGFTQLSLGSSGDGGGSIEAFLPLPNSLSYQSEYKWETVELGTAGHVALGADSLEEIAGRVKDDVGNAIHRALAQSESQIANTYNINRKMAPNPKEAIAFKGVTFRSYSLEFTITGPDAETVKNKANFVNQLHIKAAPELVDKKYFWKYPPSGVLSISGPGGITILPHREVYVTSISTDLNPGGDFFATYAGGAPVQFLLTIGFIEKALPSSENDENLLKL